ncbi:hypothetical protein CPB83DRAFT_894696 [Crepidotus variabilis]|uniref:RRM domain-containing protein n=1 Tax=Crepidotus variabilis TaxID=179855 RepID=A0A9P6JPV5_9AGAR|nr:hypothetical protein CPB83DRAFT_894696 [Crepidotus variabilis]
MSRPYTVEYDYASGSGQRQLFAERVQTSNFIPNGSTSHSQQDRHPTASALTYAGYGGALSRSSTFQERDQSAFGHTLPELSAPNRHNSSPPLSHLSSPFSPYTHQARRSSPPSTNSFIEPAKPPNYSPNSNNDGERDNFYRQSQGHSPQLSAPTPTTNALATRSTLCWGDLEPWMDEEYAKQVCGLMGWDPVNIKVPHPAPDSTSGQQPNNPGYCFLTFPSPAHAAAVMSQVNGGGPGKPPPSSMPNSNKPFTMGWATNMNTASPLSSAFPAAISQQPPPLQHQFQKEYSIFVGDLAPETSNSDLVAVFRNPVLGLRSDREPKFIRPFLSCKSAKIMLDPVTGVSRGYGFVRFTDESDQQRALIEMHGLYCLSRPMRISPATAKFKSPPAVPGLDGPVMPFAPPMSANVSQNGGHSVTLALPIPDSTQSKSVSAPIAATNSTMSVNSNLISNSTSGSSFGGSNSSNSLSSTTGSSVSIASSGFARGDPNGISPEMLAQMSQQFTNSDPNKIGSYSDEELRRLIASQVDSNPGYQFTEESWKHHAQARAILSNLIGPNGEQLTSTDPYNTTVFVGGLSPLISEETLRTFFAPFGDIHYVKVPLGKHCGFVQFVRKADAERAIEKMQGFPIGGSRIRLSWGRSQYKAAQAAAQAAQAAAFTTPSYQPAPTVGSLSQEQALQLLQKLGMSYPTTSTPYSSTEVENALLNSSYSGPLPDLIPSRDSHPSYAPHPGLNRNHSQFSPFSPDPNNLYTVPTDGLRRDTPYTRLDTLPHPSQSYAPGFFPQINTGLGRDGKTTPPGAGRPASATRYTFAENTDPSLNRAPGRLEGPISRPNSGKPASPSHIEKLEADPIHDLNGTFASLDIDRTWRSPAGSRTASG